MFAYVIRPYVALECTKPSEVEQHVIIQQSSRMPESLRRLAIDAAVEQCKNQTNEIQKCEAVGACINVKLLEHVLLKQMIRDA